MYFDHEIMKHIEKIEYMDDERQKRQRRLPLGVSKKAKRVEVDWKDEKRKKYWNDKLNIKK